MSIASATAAESKVPAPPTDPSREEYYELYRLFVDTMDQVERNYVKEVDRRELMEAAIKGVLTELDPYSSYINPKELGRFRSSVEAEFGGIGIQISLVGGQLTVLSPLVGTPAYRAGILAGDRIVKIEGETTEGITIDEAVRRLKGKENTEVTLTVVHPGSTDEVELTIRREVIHVETVLADDRKEDDSWDFMLRTEPRIGYIRITAFSRDTVDELRDALDELTKQKVQGLILDLRFNPGGLLGSAIEVSDLFVSKGRIVSTEGRNSPAREWDAKKSGTYEGFPMAVLVNRFSASASEIVSACLQDHKRAVIVGERTWGKGSVQNVVELEGGLSALKLTTASYRRPSGKNIHRFNDADEEDEWGVMPDDGFELKLSNMEMMRLVEDRRRRDILRPHAPPKDDPDAEAPQPDESEPDEPETPEDGEPEEADPDAESEGDSPEEPDEASRPVDRQLEMAVDYLIGELAKEDEPGEEGDEPDKDEPDKDK